MTRHTFTLTAVVAAFVLSQAPAFGQAGSRPNPGSSTTGTSAPRGGEGGSSGGATASSPSSGSSSTRGGGSAATSADGGSMTGSRAVPREAAPQRPMSMPRGAAVSGGTAEGRAEAPGARMSPGDHAARAVPTYSRPRDGRTALGESVERRDAPVTPGRPVIYYPYYPSYWGSYYGSPYAYGLGYGLGFGYFGYYDPWMFGGYGGGYGYGAPSYSAGGYSSQAGTGRLRLRVQPTDAHVYVDGYYVGVVNDFNGLFQRLTIDAGAHRIELRADGYEPVEFEVFVTPGETITYRGEMKPRSSNP